MRAIASGLVHGTTVTLDAPVPALEGSRVRLVLETVAENGARLDAAATLDLWNDWLTSGPQGPIDDEGEPEFP